MAPKKPKGMRPQEPTSQDHYFDLGLPRSATHSEIKKAFRKLVLIHHPDKKAPGTLHDDTIIKRLNDAWACLSDKDSREAYDRNYSYLKREWIEYRRDVAPWEIYEKQLRDEEYRQEKEREAQEEALRKQRKKEEEEEAARIKREAEEREKAKAEEAARIKREAEERKKAEDDRAAEEAARLRREAEKRREEEERREASNAEYLRTYKAQFEELLRRDKAVQARRKSIISEQDRHDRLTEKHGPMRSSRGTCVCLGCEARFNRLLEEKKTPPPNELRTYEKSFLHDYKLLSARQREREAAQRRQQEAERQAKARLREQEEEERKILEEERAGKPKTAGERMYEKEELRKQRDKDRKEAILKEKEQKSKAAEEKRRLENDAKAKERLEKKRQEEIKQKAADQIKQDKKARKARAKARKKDNLHKDIALQKSWNDQRACAMKQQETKEREKESAQRASKRAAETGNIRDALQWICTRKSGYLKIIYEEKREPDINEVNRYIGWTKKKGATVCLHCGTNVKAFSFKLPTGEAFCNPCKTTASHCVLPPQRSFASSTGYPTEKEHDSD